MFSCETYTWTGLDRTRVSVIPAFDRRLLAEESRDAFTSVTAVLRAAGLAADHHQPHRAVFERLDGRVGFVERQAQSYLRAFGERVSRLLLDPDARRPHGRNRADPRARPLPDGLTKSEPHGAQ